MLLVIAPSKWQLLNQIFPTGNTPHQTVLAFSLLFLNCKVTNILRVFEGRLCCGVGCLWLFFFLNIQLYCFKFSPINSQTNMENKYFTRINYFKKKNPVIEFICTYKSLHSVSKILYYPNHSNRSKEAQVSIHTCTFTGLEKC